MARSGVPSLQGLLAVLCALLLQPLAAQVEILDPAPGGYVSDRYVIEAQVVDASQVVRTELWIDHQMVMEREGWSPKLEQDFGEQIRPHVIQVKVELRDGSSWSSPEVRTSALQIDLAETARVILVSASVKRRGGELLGEIPAEAFRVFEDGQQLEMRTFQRETLPLDLAIVLDTSSSLRADIAAVRDSAALLVREMAATDRIVLYEFKDRPIQLLPFTNDRKTILAKIEALEPLGETALFDGLRAGLDEFSPRGRGRRALLLFTDGRDSLYESAESKNRLLRELIALAQNREIAVYTIGLGKRIQVAALEKLAEETGGSFRYAEGAHRLRDHFAGVLAELKNQYVLGVVPRATAPGFHRLQVKVDKRGAIVSARHGYTLQ